MSEMVERVAKALEPKCRGFGFGDMPMMVAREFARAAIEELRNFDESDFTFTEAEAIRRFLDGDVK